MHQDAMPWYQVPQYTWYIERTGEPRGSQEGIGYLPGSLYN